MSLHIFTVTVETQHVSGKFVGIDAIRDEIMEAIAQAEVSEIEVEDGTVEVVSFEVEHDDDAVNEAAKAAKAARAARRKSKAEPAPSVITTAHSFAATLSPEGCGCGCGGSTPL